MWISYFAITYASLCVQWENGVTEKASIYSKLVGTEVSHWLPEIGHRGSFIPATETDRVPKKA